MSGIRMHAVEMRLKRTSVWMAALVFVSGLLTVVGWTFDVAGLRTFATGSATMKMNTGLGLMLAAASLALANIGRTASIAWPARILAALVFALGVVTVAEYLLPFNPGFDGWFVTASPHPGNPFPSRMSPLSAAGLVCAGFALLTIDTRRTHRVQRFELATILMMLLATLGPVGYAYGASAFYRVGPDNAIAIHTALSFVALGCGILAARPDAGIAGLLSRNTAGATMARRLLPAAILIPIGFGWLALTGQRAGFYDVSIGTALLVMSLVTAFVVLMWRTALSLDQSAEQRQRAEQALLASEQSFSTMFRSLPVAAVLSRFPDGTIVDCNDAFVALTGYAREEIVGKTSIEAGLVRDVAARQRALDSVERVGAVRNVDLTYYTKTGEPREIVTNVNVIELQGTRYVLSSVADITERKRAEEAVRRAMEFDEAVMSNMGEGLYTVDSQGLVTSMNPMAERLFGWTLEELRGRRMHDVTHYKHPDGSPFPAEECAGFQVLRQGRTLTDYEDVFIRRDGTFFDVVYSSSPLTHGDTITGLVVVFRDITDRKRAQEALRASEQRARRMAASAETANRLKDQFLATLSHELRTPLNAILGCARMLRMDAVPPLKRDRAVQIIERNAILQTQLVEDLLDISRITNGEIRLEMKKLPAAAPLREAIENVTPTAEASRVGLDTNIDPAAGDITGDPRRLQQVFWNLLSNAVKFTPEGGLVAVSLQSERGTIVVSVRDTGIGISSEFLPYIFEPFRQAGGGVSRQFGGLGLGLAICKRLIDLHAGSLTVESAGTGQGATFTVRLPRHIPSRVASDDSADGGEETTERRDGTHDGRPFRA